MPRPSRNIEDTIRVDVRSICIHAIGDHLVPLPPWNDGILRDSPREELKDFRSSFLNFVYSREKYNLTVFC